MTALRTKIQKFSQERMMLILGIYILCQPLLDILTALGVKAEHPVTAGVLVRALFVAACFLYAVFVSEFKGKRVCMIYTGVLVGYLALFMAYMLSVGGFSLCLANLAEVVKTFFAPFVAIFLYCIYRQYGFAVATQAIGGAGAIYTSVIVIAFLTGTSNVSYGNSGNGYNGWFYAANETSCIIALTAPFAVYHCLKLLPTLTKKTWWQGVLAAWVLVSVAISANFIGTKIVLWLTLIYCIAAFVWLLVRFCQERSRARLVQMVVAGLLCVLIVGLYFRSPAKDYFDHIYTEIMKEDSELRAISQGKAIQEASEGTWLRELLDNSEAMDRVDRILSRRLFSASPSVQVYLDGGIGAKLLGIGYRDTAAYGRSIEFMIEMDPPAIFIRHGIIGFALYVLPYLAFIVYAAVQFFKRPGQRLGSLLYCTLLYCVLIGFAIATIAGHALVSPAVSIFVLVIAMQFWVQTQEQNKLPKKQKA